MNLKDIKLIYGDYIKEKAEELKLNPNQMLALIKTYSGGEPFFCQDSRYGLFGVTKTMVEDYRKNAASQSEYSHDQKMSMYDVVNDWYLNTRIALWWYSHLFNLYEDDIAATMVYELGIATYNKNKAEKKFATNVATYTQKFKNA